MLRCGLALGLVGLLACAHAPPPTPGPRPLGDGSVARNAATVQFRPGYELLPDRVVALHIKVVATGEGSVGPVVWSVSMQGFSSEGPTQWTGEVATGATDNQILHLRPTAPGVARVILTYGTTAQPDAGELSIPFLVTADSVRPCQASDPECTASDE